MVDMRFIGSQFTWKRGTVQERLDFFVCNEDWKDKVNIFQVSHLPQVQSDHNPLLLSYNNVYQGLHFLYFTGY